MIVVEQLSYGVAYTYVEKDEQYLKKLNTPNIIRTEQPNEVLVELYAGHSI